VPPGTTTVHARVGVGQIQVEPPDGIALQVVGRSGLGQVQALGREESGVGSRLDARSDLFDGAARRLVLDLRVGIGQVQVSS
jgi:predicted membrane protein